MGEENKDERERERELQYILMMIMCSTSSINNNNIRKINTKVDTQLRRCALFNNAFKLSMIMLQQKKKKRKNLRILK